MNTIPIKSNLFCNCQQTETKVYKEKQKAENIQHNIDKGKQSWRIYTTLFKVCCKTTVTLFSKAIL